MFLKLFTEILFIWAWFMIYMVWTIKKHGAIDAAYFYPKKVQHRLVKLGLTTKKEIKLKKVRSFLVLVLGDLFIFTFLILFINKETNVWVIMGEYYLFFIAQELFDLVIVDILWVGHSTWWDIEGTEDLKPLWHNDKLSLEKKVVSAIAAIPLVIVLGSLCSFISTLI